MNLRQLLHISFLSLLPLFSIAQKVSIKGIVSLPKADKNVFERLKTANSWKVWKGSDYEAKLDSNGVFNLSLAISQSGSWKISVGNKRSKVHLNLNQNIHLELDSNLFVKKIIRQDLIDSPLQYNF